MYIASCIACAILTSCGGFGAPGAAGSATTPSQTPNASAGTIGALGNIISAVIGGAMTNQNAIVGTWTYTKPCVQFESENLLAKAGGAIAASRVENQLSTYYEKLGIKPGTCTFIFGQNGECKYQIGNAQRTGTYTFDSATKAITIKTQMGQSVKAYITVTGANMGLTFDASKLLTLVNAASAASSSLSQISSISKQFSGMKLGFQFSR